MSISHSKKHRRRVHLNRKLKEHYAGYRTRANYGLVAAYVILAITWTMPFPNPVRFIVVFIHELGHVIGAYLTGGRVLDFSATATGAGATIVVHGIRPVVLLGGHVGSAFFGGLMLYLSGKAGKVSGDFASRLIATPCLFMLRFIGAACCLYAPFEVITEVVGRGRSLTSGNQVVMSDISQLADITLIPPFLVGLMIVAFQLTVLVIVSRYSSKAWARATIKNEVREKLRRKKEKLRLKKLIRELRSIRDD